ncbi:diacylglycerol kinase eta [Schistocerca americana]|uniref:diacylglycerol kinase eta n=1 Tax=Schistocerca americana TaxID=7009 RepID=UPI001F4FDFDC|nr:diacylglycerol kinase eta [Schistocerca americana]XP_049948855.1 diacylglycerol kinase eta-like [Schistocerca serialis cubense]
MEEWISALKASSSREYYESGENHDFLSGQHRWYATSHARPTYCNVCREALSGVMSHGLSCEVCKFKVHKRCAVKAISNCKWTTLSSVGKDIIEDMDGNLTMPHQWMEGNLPVSAKCAVCERTCGSVLRLQDWRCLWCHTTVHTACRPLLPVHCLLGPSRLSVVPPTALHNAAGSDEVWDAVRPQGCSPLLVFVNSKSGDNQGVKFLRRFKQLLNPAQVFDLIHGGPRLGLRLFRHFEPFRILVCSGDGSVGWVLSEIDRLDMHKQCQVGVLPLGTGNDLARVLGWGSSCDDDSNLPQLLERYEKASTKMLDRWSIMTFERSITIARKLSQTDPAFSMAAYEDSVVNHLTKILQSDEHSEVISSAKILCETVKDFTMRAAEISLGQGDDQFGGKCKVLNEKLDLLLATLHDEEKIAKPEPTVTGILPEGEEKGIVEQPEKETPQPKRLQFAQKEALMSRANSLKKAVRQLVEHTEQAVDEQNSQQQQQQQQQQRKRSHDLRPMDSLKVLSSIDSASSTEPSPCPSPLLTERLTSISPLPDLRRDSAYDEMLTLPAPDEFADAEARRRSLEPPADTSRVPSSSPSPVEIFLTVPSDDDNSSRRSSVSDKEAKDIGNLIVKDARKSYSSETSESGVSVISPDASPKSDLEVKSAFAEATVQVHVPAGADLIDSKPQENQDYLLSPEEREMRERDVARRISVVCLEDLGHIDSPETTEMEPNSEQIADDTLEDDTLVIKHDDLDLVVRHHLTDTLMEGEDLSEISLRSELVAAGFDVYSGGIVSSPEDETEPLVKDEIPLDEESTNTAKIVRGCSLAHFSEGNDIARRSFYKQIKPVRKTATDKSAIQQSEALAEHESENLDVVKIQIQGSNNNLSGELAPPTSEVEHRPSLTPSEVDEELLQYHIMGQKAAGLISPDEGPGERPSVSPNIFPPVISVIVDPPSPAHSDDREATVYRRFSDDSTGKLSAASAFGGTRCSPAATRRISSGSLFMKSDAFSKEPEDTPKSNRRLPIINPLVRLPMWPNVSGAGVVSKVLLANADALCAAVSPLMDPDETLLEGYYERCVMNNYFGIGIDAKISLDFHQKREEHPEKCRSRAKNYMWYGVLGSKEWLQKTYKNLEQRVQLECDGQRIPLPSLQGIVVLNIPSFMGGTNFWGGTKEDDIFLAPSFDDRILEVVAVFGSVQMAASRLINLQHHRIAQCHSVQINILGDEGVPVQVDGEAWIQPPGMIRIIHKNRMQMLYRNRALETSLRTWEEKQRQMTHSQSAHSQTQPVHGPAQAMGPSIPSRLSPFSPQENQLLLSFIESTTTVVKYVKLVAISHPMIEPELYQLAVQASTHLEKVHPGGKIVEGPNLRPQVTELVSSARQLYEEACSLLRDKAQTLRIREDLEGKLSAALGSLEMELRRCVTYDSAGLVHFQPLVDDQSAGERKSRSRGLFRLKFRRGSSRAVREVSAWGVVEVAAWLEALGLAEYAESFTRNDIRGRELLALGRRDLRELGVVKVGHVKRILAAIRDLSS